MLTAALLSSYAAIDAAFWADVDSRVGVAATPRFRQYCANFRDAWAAEAAPDPAASALDDEVARPSLLATGQFVTRHAGAFPGLTARPFWDAREFPWLEPLVAAAPAMAAELEAARGDAYDAALAPGQPVDVFFEDGTSDTGTIDRRVDGEYDVRYADDEVERLDRSSVAPQSSAWLQKLRKRYPWPRALEATGFEHLSLARALAGAEKGAFTATRAAMRACRDSLPPATGRFHQYGSPRFVGYSRHRPRSVLAAHSDLWNWCLTAHVPLQMPATPRPGTRVDPPSLEAQAAVAPRHTRSGGAVAASDRAAYAEALWGEEGERAGSGAAGMIVAGEARPWTEPLVFDTSYVHSAYNDGDAPADYLHIDFYHPELTADERHALSIFQRCQGRWKKSRAALAVSRSRNGNTACLWGQGGFFLQWNWQPQCAQTGVGQPSPASRCVGWPWRLQSGQTRCHSPISSPRKPQAAHAFEFTGGPRSGLPFASIFEGCFRYGSSALSWGEQQSA